MNLYEVSIDNELYRVQASTVLSAIRKAMNEDNLDRRENDWMKIDREAREHPIEIRVTYLINTLLDEEKDD